MKSKYFWVKITTLGMVALVVYSLYFGLANDYLTQAQVFKKLWWVNLLIIGLLYNVYRLTK